MPLLLKIIPDLKKGLFSLVTTGKPKLTQSRLINSTFKVVFNLNGKALETKEFKMCALTFA